VFILTVPAFAFLDVIDCSISLTVPAREKCISACGEITKEINQEETQMPDTHKGKTKRKRYPKAPGSGRPRPWAAATPTELDCNWHRLSQSAAWAVRLSRCGTVLSKSVNGPNAPAGPAKPDYNKRNFTTAVVNEFNPDVSLRRAVKSWIELRPPLCQ
jgi:hypothetical protein